MSNSGNIHYKFIVILLFIILIIQKIFINFLRVPINNKLTES